MTIDQARRVLVVEDDESMRESLEALLDAAGMPAIGYESAEALLQGDATGFALCVISDVQLPAMSGLDLLTELRCRHADLPVIVITAHHGPGLQQDAMRRGASAYLAKPFEAQALLDAIRGATIG